MTEPMPAICVRLRAMAQRLLAAGVPKHCVCDRIIGESMAHCDFFQRGMQAFGEAARMVKVDMPRRSDADPTYFRSGGGSVGARRSVAGFEEYLLGDAP
jgi:hypothetical protein